MEWKLLRVHLDAEVVPKEGEDQTIANDEAAKGLSAVERVEAVWVGAPSGLGRLQYTVEMSVNDTDDVAEISERLRATLADDERVQTADIDHVSGGQTVYQKACRVGGETFFARKPDTDVCRSHWYDEEVKAATGEYQPLIDAIKAATGLDSWVWQSGGMTMTLVTGSDDPYAGDRYLTLVEGFHEDGTLEGSTGFFPAGSEDNDEGTDVVQAYASGTNEPGKFGRPIIPTLWAELIAAFENTRIKDLGEAKLYLVTVEGGIHPEVHGPFLTEAQRSAEAARLAEGQDHETDALFHAEVSAEGGLRIEHSVAGDGFESR